MTPVRGTLAALSALGLVAGTLALVVTPAPASAAEAPVLRWEVSQQFDDHLGSHELGDGATEDSEGVVTFPRGVGSYDPATGVSEVSYQGSVRGAFRLGQEFYHVRIEDPTLVVDGEGRGEMSALVSAANIAAQGEEAQETQPARVVMFGFDATADDWSPDGGLASLSATPDWAGVIEPGSEEAAELEMEEGTPREGKAWALTFQRQITSGVRAHFYATGSGSDEKKRPAPFVAQATPTDVVPEPPDRQPLELAWQVSPEFTDAFDRSLAGGATEADGVLTFPAGRGTYDQATGVTSVAYEGSVTGEVPDRFLGFTTRYAVTLADPVLSVDAAGAGVLTAVVSGETPGFLAPLLPGTSTTPTRVTVATFSVGDGPGQGTWTTADEAAARPTATLVVTPDWSTVGRTFPPAFLEQLTEESRDHFRATGPGAAEDAKAPSALRAVATMVPSTGPVPEPEPEPCVPAPASPGVVVELLAEDETGATYAVEGEGFRAETCPGDSGVYVGIAEGRVLPDVSDRDNMGAFEAVDYLTPTRLATGSFRSTLTVGPGRLEPGTTYSVFTWQAHTHSNTTQDTVTPLPVPDAGPAPSETSLRVVKEPTSARAGAVKVVVTGTGGRPSGAVRLKVKQKRSVEVLRARLRTNGRVKVRLEGLERGRLLLVATYVGSDDHDASKDRLSLRVR